MTATIDQTEAAIESRKQAARERADTASKNLQALKLEREKWLSGSMASAGITRQMLQELDDRIASTARASGKALEDLARIEEEVTKAKLERYRYQATEQAAIVAADREDAAQLIKLLDAITAIERRRVRRYQEAWGRWKQTTSFQDVTLPEAAALRPGGLLPPGMAVNVNEHDTCSCLFSSVKVLLDLAHKGVLSGNDPLKGKADRARTAGAASYQPLTYPQYV